MENKKPTIERCNRIIDDGFSLITIGEGKIPNIKWKNYQTTPMDKDTFENFYKLNTTKGVGIICGYDNLEVIDVDLKVLTLQSEQINFWDEYTKFLKDNIIDFEKKFVIVRTKNAGYHILYKCKKIQGNTKIAKLKGQTEAIIESRGIGGYVFVYDEFVQGHSYYGIKEISEEDREILWTTSAMYNYIEPVKEQVFTKKDTDYNHESSLSTWDDYNEKTSVFDLISSEFTIVRKISDRTVIRRIGAKSPHSGYVFDNSKCMYLFTTGTQYPNEKLLSPFSIYAIQNHAGDLKEAARDLYSKGYGARYKRVEPPKSAINFKKETVETYDFPLEIFPDSIQSYILEVHNTLNASIDYLGCAMLWVLSLCVGNSMKIEVKKGWVESGVLWIAIVGRAGIGKTHNIEAITRPLMKLNEREIKRYRDNLVKYDEFQSLERKEKELAEKINPPQNTQFIVGDATIEALLDLHSGNRNGVGILRDELSGWIKDLNKYRPGSDLETYLSCWSNGSIMSNRKTAKNSYVSNAFVPIIGGVQPSILSMHYTPENKENGFIDRILLCYPELVIEKYNEREMSEELISWYSDYVMAMFDNIRNSWLRYDDFGNILPFLAKWDKESKIEWVRIFNKITDLQNSETENEYMKSILPKQKSYVCRFALLMNILYSFNDNIASDVIVKKSILSAEKLSDYFIRMAKKNKFENIEDSVINDVIRVSRKITAKDQFLAIYESDKNFNRTRVADKLNVSRATIINWIKEIEGSKK
jgi:hypothetical protein